jgi:hypothetical protein
MADETAPTRQESSPTADRTAPDSDYFLQPATPRCTDVVPQLLGTQPLKVLPSGLELRQLTLPLERVQRSVAQQVAGATLFAIRVEGLGRGWDPQVAGLMFPTVRLVRPLVGGSVWPRVVGGQLPFLARQCDMAVAQWAKQMVFPMAEAIRNMIVPLEFTSRRLSELLQLLCRQWSMALAPMVVSLGPALRRVHELWVGIARAGLGLVRGVACEALLAALDARDAVLRGDRSAVMAFIARWLGWEPIETRVEAVSAVLLEMDWGQVEATDSLATLQAWREFRMRALQQHRVHRPVWETRSGGYYVDLLHRPVRRLESGELVELGDTLADRHAEAALAAVEPGYDDQRLERVLARLRPADRTVVLAFEAGASSWRDAAMFCGRPPEDGDKIRCRVKYVRGLLEGR